MISARKISSNCANARASTGPKTAEGRACATRNALRHGLSLPAHADPDYRKTSRRLRAKWLGSPPARKCKNYPAGLPKAQIDLRRVRCGRRELFSNALGNGDYDSRTDERKKLRVATFLRQRIDAFPPMGSCDDDVSEVEAGGSRKFATILSDMAHQLSAMDSMNGGPYPRRKFRNSSLR